jgi:hypothetical protein
MMAKVGSRRSSGNAPTSERVLPKPRYPQSQERLLDRKGAQIARCTSGRGAINGVQTITRIIDGDMTSEILFVRHAEMIA